jgi:hypothetical protein
MAWISVYQQVKDHPKTREFAKQLPCSRHEAIGILVCLWLWGIDNADSNGVIKSASEQDIADGVLYHAQCAAHLVHSLMNSGWLHKSVDHFILHDWDVWQQHWYKAIEKREANTRRMRETRTKQPPCAALCATHRAHNGVPHVQASPSPLPNRNQTVKSSPLTPQGEVTILPIGFDEFWHAYPKKAGKQQAYKAWMKLKPSTVLVSEILAAIDAQKFSAQWNRNGGQFIPHPSSWLNGRRWEDETQATTGNALVDSALQGVSNQ